MDGQKSDLRVFNLTYPNRACIVILMACGSTNISVMFYSVISHVSVCMQIEVAVRDNAQRLYASKLKAIGRGLYNDMIYCKN